MISVAEALQNILKPLSPVGAETISFEDGVGRVLAADILSRRNQPPNDVSAMDGYAVKYQDLKDLPVTLPIVGESPAGGSYDKELQSGETVRIFTGATLPEGADSVNMQENANRNGDVVEFFDKSPEGAHIRRKGMDFEIGQKVLFTGHRLTDRDIGLIASVDVPWIHVSKKPRIAFLATGDELVRPGETVGPNQIISSNSYAIAAAIRQWGGEPIDLGVAKDTPDDLVSKAAAGADADMFLTLGGASVGDHDLIQSVLGQHGLEVSFWKIAMKPGKPLIHGTFKGIPMMGLPGNPTSALVCAFLYLRPAVAKMLGCHGKELEHRTCKLALSTPLKKNGPRANYARGVIHIDSGGTETVKPLTAQDSSMLTTYARADGLIVQPPDDPGADAGQLVDFMRF